MLSRKPFQFFLIYLKLMCKYLWSCAALTDYLFKIFRKTYLFSTRIKMPFKYHCKAFRRYPVAFSCCFFFTYGFRDTENNKPFIHNYKTNSMHHKTTAVSDFGAGFRIQVTYAQPIRKFWY